MHCIYYNYLLITDRIVKILALSIVSLQLAVSKLLDNVDFASLALQVAHVSYYCLNFFYWTWSQARQHL